MNSESGSDRSTKVWNLGMLLGSAFLALQVASIVKEQFGETRYFCWAPHTIQAQYSLQVEVEGKLLTRQEVKRRYGLHGYGWEAHAIQNLINLLIQHELTYGKGEDAQITLEYRVNGRELETWRWPIL